MTSSTGEKGHSPGERYDGPSLVTAAGRPGDLGRGPVGRRGFVRAAAAACLTAACRPPGAEPPGRQGPPRARVPDAPALAGPIELWSWFDLPDDPRSRELSGLSWDAGARTLWAVQDERSALVPLYPDRELRAWRFGPSVPVRADFPLDLEGVVALPDGFVVSSEEGPRLLEVDLEGRLRRELPLPAHLREARHNKSLESLTLSPDGRFLFTANEAALLPDGPMASVAAGTRIRVLRMSRDGLDFAEHAYTTDPSPHPTGDYGVADLAALSADELLVLERGWAKGFGNTARIHRARLTAASRCLDLTALRDDTPTMGKTLLVDLAALRVTGLPPPLQPQASPLLDNFEGLALGPRLADGRSTLLLVSDDNARDDQRARIVVLAVG